MRLTTILLTIVLFKVSAVGSHAQSMRIDLLLHNATLKEVLRQIENKSEYTFFYNDQALNLNKRVNVHADNSQIGEILAEVLPDCTFRIENNNIIIIPDRSESRQQDNRRSLTGLILDNTGDPIIGANISIEGSTGGTITDMDGRFTLEVEPSSVLMISYVGYIPQRVAVNNQTNLQIRLEEDLQNLEEVVVVGYGTQKRVSVTGSLAVTAGKDIAAVPTVSVTNTLVGRLPGLVSYTRNGEPGYDDAGLLIRGASTTGDSSPLIVVDGVADRAGGFSRIDPNDIESVTILKDASAAIYGSRAANGVILVTTKRGKEEKITVNYNGNVGFSSPTVLPEMASSAEYAELLNELTPGSYSAEAIRKFRDGSDPVNNPNVDAFDLLIRQAVQTRHNISLSGGSKLVNFYASVGYQYQDNYYKNSASNYNQYNLRSNLDITPHKNLKIGLDLAFRQEDRNSPIYGSEDIWRYLIKYNPMVNIYWPGTGNGNNASKQDNFSPATGLDNTMGYTKDKKSYLNADITLHLDMPWITKGLSFDGGAYIDRYDGFYKQFQHIYYLYNYDQAANTYSPQQQGSNVLNQNMGQTLGITFNARLNYSHMFNNTHNVNVFVAYEQYKSRYDYMSGRRQDFISTAIDQLFAGDSNSQTNDGTASETARMNYFGRVDYDYLSRYLFQFNWRYDGSENFPSGNRFGFFPGISAGWRISEESFWKNNVRWMDYLKVRASWGQMGNDKVDAFQYMTAYTFDNPGIFSNGIQSGVWLNRTANPNITWEVANTYNVGIESKFLNYFNFEIDFFKTKRNNILATRNAAIPDYAGLTLPDENIGECSNLGTEIVLGYARPLGNDWRINLNGNFTYNKSKIDYIDEPGSTLAWQKRTGLSIGTDGGNFLMYEADGIFRTQEELDAYPHLSNTRVGDLRVKNINEDDVIDGADKVRQDKPAVPRIIYGLNIGVNYKEWSLNLLLQGAAQVWQYTFMESGTIGNFTKDFYDNRWTETNLNAKYPRTYDRATTVTGSGDYRNSFWLENSAYLRLKNIELAYNLPRKLLSSTPFGNVRFSLSGYNLLTLTGVKNFDPETRANNQDYAGWNTPQSKVFNFGVNVTF